nr:MAG TPA: hypothetical protein [Caudoviricetes sp.]
MIFKLMKILYQKIMKKTMLLYKKNMQSHKKNTKTNNFLLFINLMF